MKKGYAKLLIFEFIFFIILLLNSFLYNVLTNYILLILLAVLIFIFNIFFGLEKDRHRYTKDITIEIIILLLIFFLVYYLVGIIIGFIRTDNYYSWNGIVHFLIPNILLIILKEYLRYQIINKSKGNTLLIIGTCFLFIFLDISNSIYYSHFLTSYDVFIFIALTLLPAISTNIVCSFLTAKTGFKPVIIYLFITTMYAYFLPIVPNLNEYVMSIISFLMPIIIGYRIYQFFEKDRAIRIIQNKNCFLAIGSITILVGVLVYFVSGYFSYQTIAIASNSMNPAICKGDVVIIKKINSNYEKLHEGQIIAYKYGNNIIVHRLIKIIKDDQQYYFYSKGDANNNQDNYVIKQDMIIGIVDIKIPYIGLPTVWLNEL